MSEQRMQLQFKKFTSKLLVRWKEILKILLALALIGIIFSKTSIVQIVDVLKGISWSWLLISFILFWLTTALKGVQYWILLGRKLPYAQIVKIVVLQNALSNLVTNTAGLASYFTLFRVEQDVNFKRAGIVFAITKVGDLFSMGVFLLISAILVWDRVQDLHQITLILLMGIFAGLSVFIAIVLFRVKFVLLVKQIVHWLRLDRFNFVNNGLDFIQVLSEQDQKNIIRALLLACCLSMVYMTATMFYTFSRVKAFNIPMDFWASVYMISFMQFISLVPIQVLGGLGVSEVVTLYFFSLFGITQIDIPATLIGRRVMTYLFYLISLLYAPLDNLLVRLKSRKNKA